MVSWLPSRGRSKPSPLPLENCAPFKLSSFGHFDGLPSVLFFMSQITSNMQNYRSYNYLNYSKDSSPLPYWYF